MKNTTTNDMKNMMNCPICKQSTPRDGKHAPFCSARCKTIDLGRWADESYKITRPIENRDLEEGVD